MSVRRRDFPSSHAGCRFERCGSDARRRAPGLRRPLRRMPRQRRQRRRARSGIAARVPPRTDQELAALLARDCPARACRRSARSPIRNRRCSSASCARCGRAPAPARCAARSRSTAAGTLEGLVLNRSAHDLQLLGDDRKLHLLRKSGDATAPVTSQTDWPSYNGETERQPLQHARRRSDKATSRRWRRSGSSACPTRRRCRSRRSSSSGIMYVTSANECYALDAGTGRQIWHYQRPRTKGLVGNAAGGVNRGVAVAGDRVFMVTDHAHLIALNRFTGELLWDTEMADWHQNYNAHRRAAAGRQSGGLRHGRRRRGRARIRRRLRSGDRQGSLALLDRAEAPASRDRKPGRARASSIRGGDDVDDRHLRSGSSTRSTGRPAIPAPISTATIAPATISIRIRSWRSMRRPAS